MSKIRIIFQHCIIVLALAAAISLAIFSVDAAFVYLLADDSSMRFIGWKETDILGILFVVVLLILHSPQRWLKVSVLALFITAQATELSHFAFFGSFYGPYDFLLLTKEFKDIGAGLVAGWYIILPPLLLSVFIGSLAMFAILKFKSKFKSNVASVLLILLVLLPTYKAAGHLEGDFFRPSYHYHSLRSGIISLSYFIARVLPSKLSNEESSNHTPYNITKHDKFEPVGTVVLVLGESVSYDDLSFFGNASPNTPKLSALIDEGKLIAKPGLSSATTTQISSGMLLNSIYEPDNIGQISSRSSNLFKLAKSNDYNVHYITTQDVDAMSYYYYDSSIDTWMDYKELTAFGSKYDSRILPALDSLNLDYSQKQFIVIHHRNAHLPYKANYPKDFDIFKPKSNSRLDTEKAAYDNSILFLDTTMANLYSYFESNTQSNAAVLYTSDHGELFGLDGIWGHIRLHPAVARVPVLTYGINLTDKIKDSLPTTQRCASTHYDVARSTAKLLGWDISSSEFNPDVAYVNGLDINGSDGYLTIDIKEAYPTSCENNDIQTKPLNSNH